MNLRQMARQLLEEQEIHPTDDQIDKLVDRMEKEVESGLTKAGDHYVFTTEWIRDFFNDIDK